MFKIDNPSEAFKSPKFLENNFNFDELSDYQKEEYVKSFPERKLKHLTIITALAKAVNELRKKKITPKKVDMKSMLSKNKGQTGSRFKRNRKWNVVTESLKNNTDVYINSGFDAQSQIIKTYELMMDKYSLLVLDYNNINNYIMEDVEISTKLIDEMGGSIQSVLSKIKESSSKYNESVQRLSDSESIGDKIVKRMEIEIAELNMSTHSIIGITSQQLGFSSGSNSDQLDIPPEVKKRFSVTPDQQDKLKKMLNAGLFKENNNDTTNTTESVIDTSEKGMAKKKRKSDELKTEIKRRSSEFLNKIKIAHKKKKEEKKEKKEKKKKKDDERKSLEIENKKIIDVESKRKSSMVYKDNPNDTIKDLKSDIKNLDVLIDDKQPITNTMSSDKPKQIDSEII